jgi:hypothetical protein
MSACVSCAGAEPPQQDFFGGAGWGGGTALLLQQLPLCAGTGLGLQQLDTPWEDAGREAGAEDWAMIESTSFCSGASRGVELALEGFDA